MLPRLSQRTHDLMRRALGAVDKDAGDLITTLVASAFVDGGKEVLAQAQGPDAKQVKQHAQSGRAA
jgi:hypothetical protein